MRVGDLGEFALISRLHARLHPPCDNRIVRGIGDDCAVLRPSAGMELLMTTDTQEEGVHFRRDWSSAQDIGWRCLAVNVSDIAAMGGQPLGAIVALLLPPTLEVAFVEALYDGMQAVATAYDCPVIGGNISQRTDTLSITITVLGETPQSQTVYRSGARVGDEIWVTGDLGGARAGLEVLLSSGALNDLPTSDVLARYRRPQPRLREAQYLRQHTVLHSLVDISDGLSSDLRHICEASGVGARLHAVRIPIAPQTRQIAAARGAEPLDYALHGGEDFELCLTAPAGHIGRLQDAMQQQFSCPLLHVGEIQTGAGVTIVQPNGTQQPLPARGYDHFRRA
jgi:thiamine-monophosphate kinase